MLEREKFMFWRDIVRGCIVSQRVELHFSICIEQDINIDSSDKLELQEVLYKTQMNCDS